MTLEEKALEVLENSELNTPQHDLTVLSKTMAGFAREHTKAKLGEAADRVIRSKLLIQEDADEIRETITKTPLD